MVRNILKNGSEVKDLTKITVPVNKSTVRAYELIAKAVKK